MPTYRVVVAGDLGKVVTVSWTQNSLREFTIEAPNVVMAGNQGRRKAEHDKSGVLNKVYTRNIFSVDVFRSENLVAQAYRGLSHTWRILEIDELELAVAANLKSDIVDEIGLSMYKAEMLAEADAECSAGEITQEQYERKRSHIIRF